MRRYESRLFVRTSGQHCARAGADDVYAAPARGVEDAGVGLTSTAPVVAPHGAAVPAHR